MSRSYRRAFVTITGVASAKYDKRLANRGVRRKHNLALQKNIDQENLQLAHRSECSWNNVWWWARDGKQRDCSRLRFSSDERDQQYYRKLLRK